MSSCRSVTPLSHDLAALGLFSDVGELSLGRVRLRLRGGRTCNDVRRAFYEFDLLGRESDDVLGDLTFMPEIDADQLETLGHVGGGLRAGAEGQQLFREALRAIAPLAQRHGLTDVVVSFPPDNAAAIHVAGRMGLKPIAKFQEHVRFALPLNESPPTGEFRVGKRDDG